MNATSPPEHAVKRVAIIAPSERSLLNLRSSLMSELFGRRHQVLCFAPDISAQGGEALAAMGADYADLQYKPDSFALFKERAAIANAADILSDWNATTVLAYGRRSMPFGVSAARRARVKRIVALLNVLPQNDRHAPLDEEYAHPRLAATLKNAHAVVCHNNDDAVYLRSNGLVREDCTPVVVPGAGVNLEHYANVDLPPLGNGLVFAMIATLEASRGVLTYCDGAARLRARAPQARFLLAGHPGSGDDAITAAMLRRYDGTVEFVGEVADPLTVLSRCHVFVYPSRVEGMPRAVLEALAASRPIITTDAPGCRETVDERVNGILVPPGSVDELVLAIESLLRRPDLIPAMARASRLKAERRFDERAVNGTLCEALGLDS